MTVTFVHAADLHLGSPLHALEGASADMATRLTRATEVAFQRTVTVAIERDVDFLVVAGDLYDREARSVRANQFLVDQFEHLAGAGIPAYVVHGNHDPLGRGAEKLDLPDNVTVFGTDAVESATYGDGDDDSDPGAQILGRSYSARHEGTNFVDGYDADSSGIPTVGVLHTGLDPDGRQYVPCSPEDLAAQGIDYWALGHIHGPQVLDGAPGAYPGIPQPRNVGEPSVGGCLVVDLDVGEAPEIQFVPTGSIVWQTVEVDIALGDAVENDQRISNLTDLEGCLTDEGLDLQGRDVHDLVCHDLPIADIGWAPEGIICRWVLTGRGEVHEVLNQADEGVEYLAERLRERLQADDPFVWTESIRDRTQPSLPDRTTLAEENDVIAEFLDLVAELRTDDGAREDMREKAGDAWEWVDDPDRAETSIDRVPLTDERLDELIDEATEVAVTRLAASQYDVD